MIPVHRRRQRRARDIPPLPWRVRHKETGEALGVINIPGVPGAKETLYHELRRQTGIKYPGDMGDLVAELAVDLCPPSVREIIAELEREQAAQKGAADGTAN